MCHRLTSVCSKELNAYERAELLAEQEAERAQAQEIANQHRNVTAKERGKNAQTLARIDKVCAQQLLAKSVTRISPRLLSITA